MKKSISVLLVLALLLSAVAALADGKLISDEPVSLKLCVKEVSVAGASYADNLPVFQAIEDRTGVSIDWEVIPAEYSTVISTRIAAMTDLPDILASDASNNMLIGSGVIIPLDDLVEQYAPNLQKLLADNPDVAPSMYGADGHLYFLPARMISMEGLGANPTAFMLRYDWLEKCGIEKAPETIDEWHDVLVAFRDMDPNGNGEKDEAPFCAYSNYSVAFSSAWGIDWLNEFYVDDNGKVQYAWGNDATRDFLATMHDWYAEGLIAPDYLTNVNMDARLLENKTGVSYMNAASNCNYQNTNSTVEGIDWRPVAPPNNVYTGERGFLPTNGEDRCSKYKLAITSSCADPVVAIRWIDYMFSDEGLRFTNIGIEGMSYTLVGEGNIIYDDAYFASDAAYENRKKAGIEPDGTIPHILTMQYFNAMKFAYSDVINEACAPLVEYFRPRFPDYPLTEEEDEVISSVMTDIKTYSNEMIHKFIIGTEPMDKFDEYLAKLNAIGLSDVLAIKQAQYDRNNE